MYEGKIEYGPGIAEALERNDWTPLEALQWYAAGKHFDTVDNYTRIIDTGAVASNALKHASLQHLELKGDAELSELRDEVEDGKQWRALALQFDRHRMMALALLKAVAESPNAANIHACQEFLAASPVPGQVVELLISADAIDRIVHYVVRKADQDVLRRIALEKRREAALTTR